MAPPFRIAFATDENGDSCPTKLATTKELVLSLSPWLRFHGVVPIGAAPPLGRKKHWVFSTRCALVQGSMRASAKVQLVCRRAQSPF